MAKFGSHEGRGKLKGKIGKAGITHGSLIPSSNQDLEINDFGRRVNQRYSLD